MINRDFNNGTISNLLSKYLGAKVRPANSLFIVEPRWESIVDDKCPFCGCKLSISPTRNIVRCISKRCISERPFVIRKDRYYEIKDKLK